MAEPVASAQGPAVPRPPLLTAQSQPLSGGATSARAHPLKPEHRNPKVRTTARMLDMQAMVADGSVSVHGGIATAWHCGRWDGQTSSNDPVDISAALVPVQ